MVTVALVGAGLAPACAAPQDATIDTVFDPCEALVIVPAADASEAELASVGDALALWNGIANTRLTLGEVADAPRLPIVFQLAALISFGLYDDEAAIVYVNRRLEGAALTITIAHELGHTFGLPHVPKGDDSVMVSGNLATPPTAEDQTAIAERWGACGSPVLARRVVAGRAGALPTLFEP